MSEVEFDDDAYFAQLEQAQKEEREAWLVGATRDDLVADIRRLESQLAQQQQDQKEALRPAHQLIDGIGNWPLKRFDYPLAVIGEMIDEIEKLRRRRSMDGRVENFLADYRPDIIAQIVACRRSQMHSVDYKWPAQEKEEYLANPLIQSFIGIRNGYFDFEHTRYWAAVINAIQDGNFSIAGRLDQLQLDLCEKEEGEGYQAGLAYVHECPYDPSSLQGRMWWRGQGRGRDQYLFGPRS